MTAACERDGKEKFIKSAKRRGNSIRRATRFKDSAAEKTNNLTFDASKKSSFRVSHNPGEKRTKK
jgi:hypothetical protein